jgi:hypothetical protein
MSEIPNRPLLYFVSRARRLETRQKFCVNHDVKVQRSIRVKDIPRMQDVRSVSRNNVVYMALA